MNRSANIIYSFLTLFVMYSIRLYTPSLYVSISNDLTQISNFPTPIPGCDVYGLAVLDLFLACNSSLFYSSILALGNLIML